MERSFQTNNEDGEFLWLISLSDLMILLFIFFVMMFASQKNKTQKEKFSTYDEVSEKLYLWAKEKNILNDIKLSTSTEGVILNIKEKILFNTGSYQLKPSSQDLLTPLSKALNSIPSPFRIAIEGHTDSTLYLKDGQNNNWELSLNRAMNVFRNLDLTDSLKKRVKIEGYASNRPVKDKKQKAVSNRRVSIRIY